MSERTTYDPKDVVVTFKGVPNEGFATDEFIRVDREPEPPVNLSGVNVSGDGTFTCSWASKTSDDVIRDLNAITDMMIAQAKLPEPDRYLVQEVRWVFNTRRWRRRDARRTRMALRKRRGWR